MSHDKNKTYTVGKHYLVELYGCDRKKIASRETVEKIFLKAARNCGATIVGSMFKQYKPRGASGAILIAESHCTIHTWPEFGYAAVDIFTCGTKMKPETAIRILEKELDAQKTSVKTVARGRDAQSAVDYEIQSEGNKF